MAIALFCHRLASFLGLKRTEKIISFICTTYRKKDQRISITVQFFGHIVKLFCIQNNFKTKICESTKKKLTTKTLERNKIIERRIVRTFINTLKYYRIRAKTVCVNKNITMFDTFKLSTHTHTAQRYAVFILLLLPLPLDVRVCVHARSFVRGGFVHEC